MDLFTLGLGTAAGALGTYALGRWQEHVSVRRGLSSQIGWAFLADEGVVQMKDGAFLCGWRYRGPDLSSGSEAQKALLAQHVNEALRPFASGWMFHFDAERRPATGYAPRSDFGSPTLALLDDERRRAYGQEGAHFETDCYLTLTYLPKKEKYQKAQRWLIKGGDEKKDLWSYFLRGFQKGRRDLEDRLSGRLRMERLSSDDLCTHLHTCLTGLRHPVRVKTGTKVHGAYLDQTLASQDFVGGYEPRVGEKHLRTISVEGFPEGGAGGLMDFLHAQSLAHRWSTRFVPLSRGEAEKRIDKIKTRWEAKTRSARDKLKKDKESKARDEDPFAVSMAEDARQALAELHSGRSRFGYYTSTIVVMQESAPDADDAARLLLKRLREQGMTGRIETVNAVKSFVGTLPGHGANLRRLPLSSRNLADLLPLTAPWAGQEENPSNFFPEGAPALMWAKTDGTTPFRVNLHVGDLGHTLIVGETGAGKSVLVGLMTAQWMRYAGAKVYVFDIKHSHHLLALAGGGHHYDIGADTKDRSSAALGFQPLRYVDSREEAMWAAGWVEDLFQLQGLDLSPQESERIGRAVRLLGENDPDERTLTTLMVNLGSERLRAALRPYTVGGTYGHLLDAQRDDLMQSARPGGGHQVLEMMRVLDLPEKIKVPFLFYLFRRVEQSLDGAPTLIVIEEAWAALANEHFAERLRQWLVSLRKQNAAVLLVTHSADQLAESGVKSVGMIEGSCATKIFLPNAEAADPKNAKLYRSLGLTGSEVEAVASGTAKRDYYLSSAEGGRMFQLGLGPAALAFLGTLEGESSEETLRKAKAMQKEHEDEGRAAAWPGAWLRMQGLTEEANRFDELLTQHEKKNEDLTYA